MIPPWWEQFGDPVLNGLIQSALQENKDLLVAAARVEENTPLDTGLSGRIFPQVGAGAAIAANKSRSRR